MSYLTIFKTTSIDNIPKLKQELSKLDKLTNITVKKEEIPAVVGNLAGDAINILLSSPIQVPLTLYALGEIILKMIEILKQNNKSYDLSGEFAKSIIMSKALKEYKKSYPNEYSKINNKNIKIIQMMEAEPISKKLSRQCISKTAEEIDDDEINYFMGVCLNMPNNNTIIFWYILRNDGKTCTSWSTELPTKNLSKMFN